MPHRWLFIKQASRLGSLSLKSHVQVPDADICTEPFNFDGIHHDRIAVPDTLRVQDTISFLVISELGVIGMLRLQTGQHPVGSSQPSVHHPRRDDIQPLPPRYRAYPNTIQRYLLLSAPQNKVLRQHRTIPA